MNLAAKERWREIFPNGIPKPERGMGPMTLFENHQYENQLLRWCWKNKHETGLSYQIWADLLESNIPFHLEYRIPDIHNYTDWGYMSVDIAYIDGQDRKRVAIEVKQKETRSEIMRGLGQCMVYKHKGFEHVVLVTTYTELDMVRSAAEEFGITLCCPWETVGVVKALLGLDGAFDPCI